MQINCPICSDTVQPHQAYVLMGVNRIATHLTCVIPKPEITEGQVREMVRAIVREEIGKARRDTPVEDDE